MRAKTSTGGSAAAEPAQTLRERIIASHDIATQVVIVKEWEDVRLLVKTMTGEERSRFFSLCTDKKGAVDPGLMTVYIVIFTVADPKTGELLFTPNDFEALRKKSGKALERLAGAAMRINGLGEDEVKAAEKN